MKIRTLVKLIPKEHGAWAMWLVPWVAGSALAPQPTWRLVLFAVGAFMLFVARGEFTRWGRRGFPWTDIRSRAEVRAALLLGAFGLAAVIASTPTALAPAAALYLAFAFVLVVSTTSLGLLRQERTIGGELLGILLLTASGPIALILGGTADLGHLLAFHGINFLFFSLSIFYVRAKVARLRQRQAHLPMWVKARLGGVALSYLGLVHLTLWALVRASLVSSVMFFAFLPITLHTVLGVVRLDRPVDLRKLGFAELAQSLVFLVGLVALWTW